MPDRKRTSHSGEPIAYSDDRRLYLLSFIRKPLDCTDRTLGLAAPLYSTLPIFYYLSYPCMKQAEDGAATPCRSQSTFAQAQNRYHIGKGHTSRKIKIISGPAGVRNEYRS
jgi:hypothetical protein